MFTHRRLSIVLGLSLAAILSALWPYPFAGGHAASLPVAAARQPVPAATPAPALRASARATSGGVIFELQGPAPAGAAEAVLWYDTEAGRRTRRFKVPAGTMLRLSVPVSLKDEGLVVAAPFDGRLDYYWALRGSSGLLARRSGSVTLSPALRALAVPPSVTAPSRWSEATTEHFRIRYFPGSEAERDVERIKLQAEQALGRATRILSPTAPVSVTIYLVPRLFWQGGVAYDRSTLLISYADRNYAGVKLEDYLTHEVMHAIAGGLVAEGSDVGNLIGEGIATYATGGHYGPEPIDDWAAVLARSDRYVPLCRLRATWRDQQHEIAYLEGASFVGYLIRTYGLPAFREFYTRDPGVPRDAGKDVDKFCAAEAKRPVVAIGKTYAQLEAEWLKSLASRKPTREQTDGLWGQLRFFDLMRQYEERRDPAARILPPPPPRWNMEHHRAFASPALTATNALHESLFVAADRALDARRPEQARSLMDEIEIATATGTFTGTVGREYASIAAVLERYTRAQRLGNAWAAASATLPSAPPFEKELWADYRWVLNGIDIDAARVTARVDRRSQRLDAPVERTALVVSLQRLPSGWRIERITPDPDRQPSAKPTVPRQGLQAASVGRSSSVVRRPSREA